MNPYSWALLAALAWGTAATLEKWGLADSEPITGVWVRSLGAMLGAALLTFFIPNLSAKLGALTPRAWTGIILGGFFGSIVGQIFFYNALKNGQVGRIASVSGSWPLIAFLLSIVFLGETPTLKKAAGALLVVAGVWCLK
jgi:bacterial/archaeal transporter family protein